MHGKLYVLLALLFIVITISADSDPPKKNGDTPSSSKKNGDSKSKESSNGDAGFPAYVVNSQNRVSPFQTYSDYNRARTGGSASAGGFSDNGYACHPLIDSQYTIFSEMCGAVPQARYVLPNSFGHNDRWQLSYVLTNIMQAVTDPVCVREVRRLLCPMLFQPCRVRHEPPLLLPCQYYCSTVKSRCAVPALDLIPCETLPYGSDYCPDFPGTQQTVPVHSNVAPPQQPAAVPSDGSINARSMTNTITRPPGQQTASTSQSAQPTVSLTLNTRGAQTQYQIPIQHIPLYPQYRQAPQYIMHSQNTVATQPAPAQQVVKT